MMIRVSQKLDITGLRGNRKEKHRSRAGNLRYITPVPIAFVLLRVVLLFRLCRIRTRMRKMPQLIFNHVNR